MWKKERKENERQRERDARRRVIKILSTAPMLEIAAKSCMREEKRRKKWLAFVGFIYHRELYLLWCMIICAWVFIAEVSLAEFLPLNYSVSHLPFYTLKMCKICANLQLQKFILEQVVLHFKSFKRLKGVLSRKR
jgi:hypothetical protein